MSSASVHQAPGVGHAEFGEVEFTPARGLRRVAEIAGVGLGLAVVNKLTGLGLSCGLVKWGIYCPFCGGTRMVQSVLGGHFGQAFHWNPMLFIGGILLAFVCLAWAGELVGGPRLRWPSLLGHVTQRKLYLVGGAVSALFMLARNLA